MPHMSIFGIRTQNIPNWTILCEKNQKQSMFFFGVKSCLKSSFHWAYFCVLFSFQNTSLFEYFFRSTQNCCRNKPHNSKKYSAELIFKLIFFFTEHESCLLWKVFKVKVALFLWWDKIFTLPLFSGLLYKILHLGMTIFFARTVNFLTQFHVVNSLLMVHVPWGYKNFCWGVLSQIMDGIIKFLFPWIWVARNCK